MQEFDRRQVVSLIFATAFAAATGTGGALADDGVDGLTLGEPQPFDWERLKAQAQDVAAKPYQTRQTAYRNILDRIDYDAFQAISFDKAHALWADGKGGDPVQLFHMGRYFQIPVSIAVVEDGQAREILYRQAYFNIPEGNPARELPQDIGFAGFRIEGPEQKTDWLAFLGASYFRSSGTLDQYGLSARGLAIDTALPDKPEEFPVFTHFWLERKPGEDGVVTAYALLDSPSVAGAYRITCRKGERITTDVDCALFARRKIERLGIAPLTSMYWYSETERRQAVDWRPEIHDSDGVAIWSGNGERIWRPLNNPPHIVTNAFSDRAPKGFGLLQRDRNFDHFQDDGVYYDKRPSVWVEPHGDWGGGQLQLVEMPTDSEINDNIVLYWVPDGGAEGGSRHDFSYRLFWTADEPYPSDLGRVAATYVGIGGIPGQPRPKGAVRFVVDFKGDKVQELRRGDGTPQVTLSRGKVSLADAYPVVGGKGLYRAFFETVVDGNEPVDMRMFVRGKDGSALTETWLYQYFPRPYA